MLLFFFFTEYKHFLINKIECRNQFTLMCALEGYFLDFLFFLVNSGQGNPRFFSKSCTLWQVWYALMRACSLKMSTKFFVLVLPSLFCTTLVPDFFGFFDTFSDEEGALLVRPADDDDFDSAGFFILEEVVDIADLFGGGGGIYTNGGANEYVATTICNIRLSICVIGLFSSS